MSSHEEQTGLAPEAVAEQSHGSLHKQHIGPRSAADMGWESAQVPPALASQRQGFQCREREKHTPKGYRASLVAQMVKSLPAMRETWVGSLDQEDPLEKDMATYSSILAWEIPWTEEPGGLPSPGLQTVGYD